ncbi:MAG: DUF3313 domain-containing protein [Planctomycetota bacterium]|jgi:hypothetical protein
MATPLARLTAGLCLFTLLASCGSLEARRTGFLSDYSKLRQENEDVWRWVSDTWDPTDYSGVIIDRVSVRLTKEKEDELSDEQLDELTTHWRQVLLKTFGKHFHVVDNFGAGVLRVRVAITDVLASRPLSSVITPSRLLLGTGLGGAAMEGELVDTATGEQIAAVVQVRKGKRVDTSGLTWVADGKTAMDVWCERADATLTAARERARSQRRD